MYIKLDDTFCLLLRYVIYFYKITIFRLLYSYNTVYYYYYYVCIDVNYLKVCHIPRHVPKLLLNIAININIHNKIHK